MKGKVPRQERLFRAAVSAFCALIRPGRRDVIQLEELTLPLYDVQPKEAKRFAAAALSEAAQSSNALIRRLCEESVDIAAPLLIRSPALSDIDLIALISRHGVTHARAIARRADLHPTIAALVRTLLRKADETGDQKSEGLKSGDLKSGDPKKEEPSMAQDAPALPAAAAPSPSPAAPMAAAPAHTAVAAERMRDRLRGFMAPETAIAAPSRTAADAKAKLFARLKMTALTGNLAFFQTALADALEIELAIAQEITTSASYANLIAALKTLDLSDEQSFMLAMAVFPAHFSHAEAVRLFVERYQLMAADAAADLVRGWQMETATRRLLRRQTPATANAGPGGGHRLKAS